MPNWTTILPYVKCINQVVTWRTSPLCEMHRTGYKVRVERVILLYYTMLNVEQLITNIMIHITDIKPDTRIQLQCGIVFTIDLIEHIENRSFAVSTMNNSTKGGYRTELNDAVLFFNENKSILL